MKRVKVEPEPPTEGVPAPQLEHRIFVKTSICRVALIDDIEIACAGLAPLIGGVE